ncbi:3330_t:CDS:2, partial [Racocetra fulgida]
AKSPGVDFLTALAGDESGVMVVLPSVDRFRTDISKNTSETKLNHLINDEIYRSNANANIRLIG